MATYVFRAMDLAGIPAKGEVEALSKQDVADQLKQRGLVVVDIAHKYRSKELNIDLFPRVKASDLAVMTRQLSTMVSSGMPILRCLYVLESQAATKLLRTTLAGVRGDVEAGRAPQCGCAPVPRSRARAARDARRSRVSGRGKRPRRSRGKSLP